MQTSKEWAEYFDIELGHDIIDPDGWDRSNFDYDWYEVEISLDEFKNRVYLSTCKLNKENGAIYVGNMFVAEVGK